MSGDGTDGQTPPWLASANAEPPASPKRLVPKAPLDRVKFARGIVSPTIPAAQVDDIRRRLAAGESRNAIARAVGVSGATVTKYAREVGHSFDRSATEAATTARAQDMRAARRELADLLVRAALDEARRREELAGKDTRARADLSRSAASLVSAAVSLDAAEIDRAKVEAEARSTSDVDAWLDHMSGAATGTEGQAGTVTAIRPGGEA